MCQQSIIKYTPSIKTLNRQDCSVPCQYEVMLIVQCNGYRIITQSAGTIYLLSCLNNLCPVLLVVAMLRKIKNDPDVFATTVEAKPQVYETQPCL